MNLYSPIEGTFDIFPEQHKYLTFLKKVFRHEFRKNGFRRITPPLLEKKQLIEKSQLNTPFIIENGDFDLCQSPSLSIMRAYLENDMKEQIQPVYYYYMSQYYKKVGKDIKGLQVFGGEIIGENDPILDAISIYVVYTSLNKIGLKDKFFIRINSIGIEKEKVKYREELLSFYENKKHILSPESIDLLEVDPMLVLSSKNEDEIILNSSAPSLSAKFLKKDSKEHYSKFKSYLDILKVPYKEDHSLVGENNFQTNSIWQFVSLDSRVIGNGSRYNTLSKNIGEPKEIPATGFYVDTSIIIDMLVENNIKIKNKDKIDLFFVQLGDEAKTVVLPLSLAAREAGINTVVSLGTPSMKEQMLKAGRSGARYVVMVGIMEARNGIFQVRDMENGTQSEVKKENLIDFMIEKIGKENLDFYSPERDLMIN
ncbi:MAG: His/Gly/Thr/Pro-type tRNA ligase C-terminal domain-containing protein [Candidatus Gracilibacteria bacterium]|nr:His/Gly/Thr/Pro-type tRNA ligase C-terminal domain-containing protein [Candidatus Gracilibacteria bacterium]